MDSGQNFRFQAAKHQNFPRFLSSHDLHSIGQVMAAAISHEEFGDV